MTGTYVAYRPASFRPERLALIGRIAQILDAAEERGEVHSVRQVYYQMVVQKVLPNTAASYAKVQSAISEGRLAGLISWTAIEDRGRALRGLPHQTSPEGAIRSLLPGYRLDLWASQPCRPEVWIEKAALEGVISRICDQERVDYYACRGYNSQSEQWAAGRRFAGYVSRGQRPIVLHLGDHDPSGIDMTRDNRERLKLFAGVPVQVVRLALNMDQVEELRLPPDPAKSTDSRYDDYERQYGTRSSWELDALTSDYIRGLIRTAVRRLRDPELWDAALAQEVEDRRRLESLIAPSSDDED